MSWPCTCTRVHMRTKPAQPQPNRLQLRWNINIPANYDPHSPMPVLSMLTARQLRLFQLPGRCILAVSEHSTSQMPHPKCYSLHRAARFELSHSFQLPAVLAVAGLVSDFFVRPDWDTHQNASRRATPHSRAYIKHHLGLCFCIQHTLISPAKYFVNVTSSQPSPPTMMMKSAFAALAFFVASACAQDVYITYPKSGSTVQAGKNLTVTISQPNDLTPVSNIAAAIGMNHCESESSCPSAQQLGYLVYSGLIEFEQYDPTQPPYANITVQPLSSFSGLYSLNAAVYSVVGAGPTASIETANILLNVE